MEEKLKKLLEPIGEIIKRHEDQARITGGNFNVFNILRLTTNEVRTHSAFIAELLNPKGCHGQGDLFLKLFCSEFAPNLEMKTDDARVFIEKRIGQIIGDYDDGGNIDIIIESGGKAIIIENKIYAYDQRKQLKRYHNYGTSKYGNNHFKLFYLTLDGSDASKDSKDNLEEGKDYFLLSYNKDILLSNNKNILSWLQDCQTAVEKVPVIKETIMQYANLIKQLTNQTTIQAIEKEITNLLITDEKIFKEAHTIFEIFYSGKPYNEIIRSKLCPDLKKIADNKSLELEIECESFTENWGFKFKMKEWKNVKICFGFDGVAFDTAFYYGFAKDPETVLDDKLRAHFEKHGDSSPHWGLEFLFKEQPPGWNKETFISILNGEFQKEIEEKVEELLNIINDNQLKPYL